jgi:hypothetical protein
MVVRPVGNEREREREREREKKRGLLRERTAEANDTGRFIEVPALPERSRHKKGEYRDEELCW